MLASRTLKIVWRTNRVYIKLKIHCHLAAVLRTKIVWAGGASRESQVHRHLAPIWRTKLIYTLQVVLAERRIHRHLAAFWRTKIVWAGGAGRESQVHGAAAGRGAPQYGRRFRHPGQQRRQHLLLCGRGEGFDERKNLVCGSERICIILYRRIRNDLTIHIPPHPANSLTGIKIKNVKDPTVWLP